MHSVYIFIYDKFHGVNLYIDISYLFGNIYVTRGERQMSYFSDREQGERPRDRDEIEEAVWGGVQALIGSRIEDGSFGATVPDTCPDGRASIGTKRA